MEYQPHDWPCYRLVIKILAIGIAVLASLNHANAETLYVSKAYGKDIVNGSNTCRNMTSPCKTLRYVIDKASPTDVIMVDSTNTTLQPYNNCSSRTFHGTLSFKSWKGFPVINCSGGGLFFYADNNTSLEKVSFQGLRFMDTFVQLTDVSLAVTNCTFGSFLLNTTYLYIINVSATTARNPLANIDITVTNSRFVKNNTAGSVLVVNVASTGVSLVIEKSSILNNTLTRVVSPISIVGLVSFSFLNSAISNTTFPNYVHEPSIIRFNASVAVETGSVPMDTSILEPKNVQTLANRASLQDKNPSVLLVRILSCNFHGNEAKILLATFSSSARVVIVNTNISGNSDINGPGGVIVLSSEKGAQSLDVFFKDCWFNSNEKPSYTPLVYFIISDSVVSNISLERCHFVNNENIVGFGYWGTGAMIHMEAQQLFLSVTSCEFHVNQAGAIYVNTSQYSNLHFSHTLVTFCSFWNDIPEHNGAMISVIFNNSPNFPKWNVALESGLLIEDSDFRDNRARMVGTGAIMVRSVSDVNEGMRSRSSSVGKVIIRRSTFLRNLAQTGTGGVHLSSNFDCDISDTVFRENAGSEAGAVYFTGGDVILRNCTLDSNYGGYTISTLASGSLRLTGQGTALIQDSTIIQGKINKSFGQYLDFHGGVSVSSNQFGSINLSNSSFDFRWGPSVEKTIVMEIAQTKDFILDNATVIRCPKGYDIKKQRSGEAAANVPQSESFVCNLCSMGSYSEDRGTYMKPRQHHVKCLACPYGAKCTKGLQVLPNFWGYQINNSNPPTIAFLQCPLGYCCEPEGDQKSCYPYYTCNSQRNGTLCGECNQGFSETLFTPFCRKAEKCNDFWFWPVAVIFVLGFSLYLVIQPDFVTILWNRVTWFSRASPQATAHDDKVFDPGFERIVFFYYQATDVLLVQSSYDVWDKYLSQSVLGLFNFEIRVNKEGFACPFPGLNPVSKVLFHSLGVFSVLFAIPFIFTCHCFLCFCVKRELPRTASYLSAFLKAVILGYAVLTTKSMKLLKCVTVNGVSCLFLNCNIHCYTWWQTLIGTLIVIYFIPFALVLFFGSYKLFHKKISALHFILGCFLPLPFLSYWFITRRTFRAKHVPDSDGRDAITSLLTGSYRAPDHVSRGAIYWESVFIGRMLILILTNVLIKEPFLRSLTLLFICIINLSLHIYVFPFERVAANRAETVSLFCLVLMAMFNLPFMGYLSEGVVPSGPISHIMKIFSWCQAVLVVFLPCVCILLALAALLSQAVRLVCFIAKWFRCACCRGCCCRHCLLDTREELIDPLITT